MKTWNQRVTEAREKAGLDKAELARRARVSPPTVTQWESGEIKNLSAEKLLAICEATDVTPQWLLTGRDLPSGATAPFGADATGAPVIPWEEKEDLSADLFVVVPHYDVKVGAGPGKIVCDVDQRHQGMAFQVGWLRSLGLNPARLMCLNASGDSMEPVIRDGAMLLVDTDQTTVISGKIYVIRYGDEIRVKRLSRRYDGALIIQSDNQFYKEEIIPPEALNDGVGIIGRVINCSAMV